MDKLADARNQGIRYALQIAEQHGIDGLRDEVSRRGINHINIIVPVKEMQKVKVDITLRTVDLVTAIALATLVDNFDFTPEQARKFYNDFNKATAIITIDPDANIEELRRALELKCNLKINVRKGIGR